MPTPSLIITPNESRNLAGPVALAESGAVRRVPFDGGQAFLVEEGTTNLILNPSGYDNGVVGLSWRTFPDRPVESTSVLPAPHPEGLTHAFVQKQTVVRSGNHGMAQGSEGIWTPVNTGQVVTASAWVYIPSETPVNGIGIGFAYKPESSLSTWTNVLDSTSVKGKWTRLLASYVIPEGVITIYPRISMLGADDFGPEHHYYFTGVQFEAKPYATSFTDGDMGDGYSWTGTPHNSTSVREKAVVSAPTPEPQSAYIRYGGDDGEPKSEYFDLEADREGVFTKPSLLLRPEGSYSWTPEDGVQEVTPTVGASVEIVDGQYGQAWLAAGSSTSGNVISVPSPRYEKQTIIVRARALPNTSHSYLVRHPSGAQYPQLIRRSWNRLSYYSDESGQLDGDVIPDNTWYTISVAWDGSTTRLYSNDVLSATAVGSPDQRASEVITIGGGGAPQIESVLIFPEALSDEEIHRISTMPEAWTMENGTVYPARAVLDDGSRVLWGDGEMKVETAGATEIGAIITYDTPLTEAEIDRLDATPTPSIGWGGTVSRVGGIMMSPMTTAPGDPGEGLAPGLHTIHGAPSSFLYSVHGDKKWLR